VDITDLREIPLLEGISDRDVGVIARLFDDLDVDPGSHLITEGSFAHEFFIILSGSVEVSIDGTVVTTLGPGDFFGEVALMEHVRRTASVVTTERSRLAVLSREAFEEVEQSMPSVAQHLREATAARMPR
jgi:CRP-like cAMP-binding protein